MLTKRNIVTVVILSIITCGIYAAWLTYAMTTELQKESGKSTVPPIAIALLLYFVSPVGGALLGYDANESVLEIQNKRGIPQTDNKILWLVIGIIFSLIQVFLVQNEINKLA